MIILHAVQKLLNTSRAQPVMYISAPSVNQYMHSWYAKLLPTGFPGKQLVMYVHEPSLLLVLAPGRSLNTTVPIFYQRLRQLLERSHFKEAFIEREMALVREGYVISKTNSRAMLGRMNSISFNIESRCRMSDSYTSISLNQIEDDYLGWLTHDSITGKYVQTRDYWVERGLMNK